MVLFGLDWFLFLESDNQIDCLWILHFKFDPLNRSEPLKVIQIHRIHRSVRSTGFTCRVGSTWFLDRVGYAYTSNQLYIVTFFRDNLVVDLHNFFFYVLIFFSNLVEKKNSKITYCVLTHMVQRIETLFFFL